MFAFAVWDRRTRTLLARDRLGIKPLYWGRQNGRFVFASELKALGAARLGPELNRDALAAYMRLATCLRHTRSIAASASSRPACRHRRAVIGSAIPSGVEEAAEQGKAARSLSATPKRARRLSAAGRASAPAGRRRAARRLPLGRHRFLGGRGADAGESARPVRTFSIGFADAGFDEGPARAVAAHLGTEHTELYVRPREAREVIPSCPSSMTSRSPIPRRSRPSSVELARQHVTVALSGDGGDELFAGYTRHRFALMARMSPSPPGRAFACDLAVAGPALLDRLFTRCPHATGQGSADKMYKLPRVCSARR